MFPTEYLNPDAASTVSVRFAPIYNCNLALFSFILKMVKSVLVWAHTCSALGKHKTSNCCVKATFQAKTGVFLQ